MAQWKQHQVFICSVFICYGGHFYPAHAYASRGYVIGRGVYISALTLEPNFYLPKYSLSEVYFNTDRLLIEFNGLWYSLAARQVFVAIANPDSLSFG